MAMTDPDLWSRIRDYPLPHREEIDDMAEPERHCRTFIHNVRKDGDWTDESAERLVEEYRRFLYLKARSGGQLTPPKVIDKVWHMHLAMGDDFKARFCTEIGIKMIHETGMARDVALASYTRGYETYAEEFGGRPPKDIWPSPSNSRKESFCDTIAMGGSLLFFASFIILFVGATLVNTILFFRGDVTAFAQNSEGDFLIPQEFEELSAILIICMMGGSIVAFVASFFSTRTPPTIARCG